MKKSFSLQESPLGYHVRAMLLLREYKKRRLVKMNDLSQVENRNGQFEEIALYRKQFTDMNFPVLNIDTQKKRNDW